MDSWRETTIKSEDEDGSDGSCSDNSRLKKLSTSASGKSQNTNRFIYSDESNESGDDNEVSYESGNHNASDEAHKSLASETSELSEEEVKDGVASENSHQLEYESLDTSNVNQDEGDEKHEGDEVDESPENDNDFEKEFLECNKFNSTFVGEVDSKWISIPPVEPIDEEPNEAMKSIHEQLTAIEPIDAEENELMKSIHEQLTAIEPIDEENELIKSIHEQLTAIEPSNSHKSIYSNSLRSSTNTTCSSNIKREVSEGNEEILNSTVESVELLQDSIDVIIISDEDEEEASSNVKKTPFKHFQRPSMTIRQPTLPDMLKKEPSLEQRASVDSPTSIAGKKQVTDFEYFLLKQNLDLLNDEKRLLDMALRKFQLSHLPDKGQALLNKQHEMDVKVKQAQEQLANAEVVNEPPAQLTWRGLEAGTTEVQPRTFGKQALQTYNNEKSLTLDRLRNLHSSLETCPTPETIADDPKGLKVELMLHQKHALAWLLWRELQKPAGGILADDMGLGKTLTMISLITAHNQLREGEEESESDDENESEEDQRQYKYNGGTLVVCPASLLGQWVNEVQDKLKSGLLSVEVYHGPKRETKAKRLAKYDMVVTTYAICQSEGESDTPLYRVKWERIILDEAHQIRNHKSKTSLAVFRLGAKRRWALTGTPVHNKEMDLFALLKFLRCSPFDDVAIFKRWISSKSGGGHQRLHTVLSSMLLRRTKQQLKELEQLTCLPEREWQLVEITMEKDEMEVYQKILLFSKTFFAQFLHQRAEKNADAMDYQIGKNQITDDPSNEYYKMHQKLIRMNKLPEVKQSDILVLLLRLRQICCHPSLITAMLDNVADLGADVDRDADISIDLLDQLNKLNIDDNDENTEAAPANLSTGDVAAGGEGVGLAEASRNLLNPSNPIFDKSRQSSKLQEVIKLLQEKIIPLNDKAIIVSQWTSLLHLMVPHLKELNIKYCHLDGTIPVKSRGEIVFNFNNPNSGVQIMLLSLTAGGVGLNLVGANHLVFLDLHWNPQLEMQAQDRIYRVGQRKKVFVYKLMTLETIEQRIKCLQDKKKEIAESLLKGAKMESSKLSLDDLKMLFNM